MTRIHFEGDMIINICIFSNPAYSRVLGLGSRLILYSGLFIDKGMGKVRGRTYILIKSISCGLVDSGMCGIKIERIKNC